MNSSMHSLWSLAEGGSCELQQFSDQLPANYKTRLLELGFHPGETLKCLKAPNLGAPKLYQVSNTVYSLDRSVAEKLLITLA